MKDSYPPNNNKQIINSKDCVNLLRMEICNFNKDNSTPCKQLNASKQLNGIQRKNSEVHGTRERKCSINSFVLTNFSYFENNEYYQI